MVDGYKPLVLARARRPSRRRRDHALRRPATRQRNVAGLKPGHQILIVGVCEKGRGANAARKLRRLLPGIYARTAQVPPGWTISRCETPELSTRLELKAGTQVLRLFQSPYDRTPTPGPPCHYRGTLMIAALVDTRTNTPQAFSVLEEALSVSGVCPDGPIALECSDTDVDRVQGAAQIRWQCQWGAAETGGEPGSMVRQARLSIHGRKIRESLRTLSQNVGRK